MSVDAPSRPPPDYPEGDALQAAVAKRKRRAAWFRWSFLCSLFVAVIALLTLLFTIINDSFGLAAVVVEVSEGELAQQYGLEDLGNAPKEDLIEILQDALSTNVGRRYEREQRFLEDALVWEPQGSWDQRCASTEPFPGCDMRPRNQGDVYALVLERVVSPDVEETYTLWQSVMLRDQVEERLVELNEKRRAAAGQAGEVDEYRDAELEFRSWLSKSFLQRPQSPQPEIAGVRTAILGSLWVVFITVVFALPVGVGAAVYLEEYAKPTRINRMIQTNINNLAGVPSIIYGMLGLAIFVRLMVAFTSGAFLASGPVDETLNGRTIISAGLTLGLLVLPLIIINAQEAIRAVPRSLREASFGLGATKWQTVRTHVLPNALPGILTGAILALARALGETAPLVVVGASTAITFDPDGPFSKFTVLPIQIYQWTSRPQDEFRNIAAAAIIVLLILLFALNATAIFLRNRYSRKA